MNCKLSCCCRDAMLKSAIKRILHVRILMSVLGKQRMKTSKGIRETNGKVEEQIDMETDRGNERIDTVWGEKRG